MRARKFRNFLRHLLVCSTLHTEREVNFTRYTCEAELKTDKLFALLSAPPKVRYSLLMMNGVCLCRVRGVSSEKNFWEWQEGSELWESFLRAKQKVRLEKCCYKNQIKLKDFSEKWHWNYKLNSIKIECFDFLK